MSSRKRQNVKKQRRMLVYLLAVVLVVLSWVRLTSKQTLVLENQRYITTYDTQTFLLKNEQVFYFDKNPVLVVSDGERVSRQTELFENDGTLQNFYRDQRSLLEKMTEIPKREELFQLLVDKKEEFKDLSDEENKDPLMEEIMDLVYQFSYADLDEEALESRKEEIRDLSVDPYQGKTLIRLGGIHPGYWSNQLDGYESLLAPGNIEALVGMDAQDLEETAGIIKDDTTGMKVIDDDTAYMMITIPKESLPEVKKQVEEKRRGLEENLENDDLQEYLSYLNRRVDVLNGMPQVSFFLEGKERTARVVAVLDSDDEAQDVFVLQLKEYLTYDFLKKRKLDIQLITYTNNGYVLPEKSLITKDGVTSIVVLNKGYLRKNLEVTVTKTMDDEVFLSRGDNESITEGMQLLINP
ncbi:hypothetical protein J0B03_01330 [Alkalibacter rhizosphaerae]|uniref:HlyD family secretion protein n=1 Tax=Alkalibacter rhizosphaerae TaxID=2815577 RepID=A0A974XI31_9FIRM|nr:HlyD family efflux transporter periplasmic adaptor subunit [Alkalibacter rhizosphaerae]QSX08763.1 hypothetical protein J0B03_01330 [Alkalibacter rhizosphaerae]